MPSPPEQRYSEEDVERAARALYEADKASGVTEVPAKAGWHFENALPHYKRRALAVLGSPPAETEGDTLERLCAAVRVCDTKAERLAEDTADPERVTSYKLRCGPWHRVLALTGTGVYPEAEESYIEKLEMRWRGAEAEADRLREALRKLDHLLAAPGGLSPADVQREGRAIIRSALSRLGPDGKEKE